MAPPGLPGAPVLTALLSAGTPAISLCNSSIFVPIAYTGMIAAVK
jgi:hypothetical protein